MGTNQFEDLFNRFIRQQSDCALLSEALKGARFRNADYLLKGQEIIAELKTLEVDTTPKLQTYAEQIIKERSIAFYGALPFNEVIQYQPDKDKLNERAFNLAIGPIERMVKEANRQIRDTKKALRLPRAAGLIILANAGNALLDWALMQDALLNLLRTKGFMGRTHYSNIGACLYLSRIKRDLKQQGQHSTLPIAFVQRVDYHPGEIIPVDLGYIEEFRNRWAKWCGVTLLSEGGEIIWKP